VVVEAVVVVVDTTKALTYPLAIRKK
jgi:hypothetical protein